jgi:hypothetical protein
MCIGIFPEWAAARGATPRGLSTRARRQGACCACCFGELSANETIGLSLGARSRRASYREQEAMRMNGRWKFLSVTCAVLGVLGLASAALGANLLKGGSYKGGVTPANDGVVVSFKVSSSGKLVTALTISNTPLYCSGGGKPTPVHFKNAAISAAGTFASTGKYVISEGPKKGQVGTRLKITGKFLKGHKEQGVLTTTYVGFSNCSGKSSYSTKA